MSLSKRDQFVRYLDPLETLWLDAEGNLHFSVENGLKAFEMTDTPENRGALMKIMAEVIGAAAPGRPIVYRDKPDSEDYFKQKHERPND